MELKVINASDGYTHLALLGKLDNLGVGEIESQFLSLAVDGNRNLIADISEVSFTGSNGLRLLLRAVKALRKENKQLILLNPQPMLKAVLVDSGIEEAVTIESNLESAIAKAKA